MKENIVITNKHTTILSILVLSLFLHIRYTTPLFIIRPFDLLTVLIFFYAYTSQNKEAEQKLSLGFFYLFPFFIIHFTFALRVSAANFFREFLQVMIFIAFAYILSHFKTRIDYKKIIINLLLGSIFIMLFSIFWHLINGYQIGWKQLPDSRIIFTIISLLIFAYLNISGKKEKAKIPFFLIVFFLLTLLSGERKALLIFFFLFVMHYSQGKILKIALISIGGYILLYLLSDFLENPYLKIKIDSLIGILDTGNFQYFLDTGELKEKDTYSNVQRIFAFSISKVYFLENPIFGVGTSNFLNLIRDQYYYLPDFFIGGIHNEFQRVLIENGLVGLFFYLFIWYKSWTRTKNITIKAKKIGLMSDLQYKFCTYSIYVACIAYVGMEASSLRSFIILIFISLLPDYLNYHLSLKTKEKI